MKAIDAQIQAMSELWPEFAVKERTSTGAMWIGVLAPDKREHTVRIRYRVPFVLENISLRDAQPMVQVLDPILEWHPDYEEGPIPHVYHSDRTPLLPYLCLFSPSGKEWSTCDLIAETTVCWTAEWLYFYEAWLVTRKWQGGGRHVGTAPSEIKKLETV
jgi:hypothetical protein